MYRGLHEQIRYNYRSFKNGTGEYLNPCADDVDVALFPLSQSPAVLNEQVGGFRTVVFLQWMTSAYLKEIQWEFQATFGGLSFRPLPMAKVFEYQASLSAGYRHDEKIKQTVGNTIKRGGQSCKKKVRWGMNAIPGYVEWWYSGRWENESKRRACVGTKYCHIRDLMNHQQLEPLWLYR